MSRVGKKPIELPSNVQATIEGQRIHIKGSKGELSCFFDPQIEVNIDDGNIVVKRPNNQKNIRALHGLYRALINNMVRGVSEGFEKKLEIQGVGYRAELRKNILILQIGFSHPIAFCPPPGIKIEVEANNIIKISGINKELVGQVAAKIRSFRPPEPYKGKGIRYEDEYVRRKAGKTAA